jgi:hypothetical protein
MGSGAEEPAISARRSSGEHHFSTRLDLGWARRPNEDLRMRYDGRSMRGTMDLRRLLQVVPFALVLGGPAEAEPTMSLPEVSHGSNPYRSYAGKFTGAGTHELLLIPEGQDFIITMYDPNGSYELGVYRNDEVILQRSTSLYRNYLKEGLAKLRVEGGATLSIQRVATWSTNSYYLQGYLTQTGGPERFVSSITPGGGTHTVFTADMGRVFIVQTLKVGTSWCEFALDGSPFSFDSFPFSSANAFDSGRGALVVPPGKSLSLTHGMAGEPCEYFLAGTYIQP